MVEAPIVIQFMILNFGQIRLAMFENPFSNSRSSLLARCWSGVSWLSSVLRTLSLSNRSWLRDPNRISLTRSFQSASSCFRAKYTREAARPSMAPRFRYFRAKSSWTYVAARGSSMSYTIEGAVKTSPYHWNRKGFVAAPPTRMPDDVVSVRFFVP